MKIALFFILIANLSCQSFLRTSQFYKNTSESRSRDDYSAKSTTLGMVASAHPQASLIGHQILEQGGNAIDAAIAVSFAISVLRPQSSGLGGGGFMLVHVPFKKVQAYDFRERAPRRATRDMYLDKKNQIRELSYAGHVIPNPSVNGHLAVATPGLVAGLLKAHADHGSLPLKQLIEPALLLAREGFSVYADLAQACEQRKNILSKFEDSKALFVPNNQALKIGHILIQRDLAWTLEQIAQHGLKGFYQGEVSAKIIAEIKRGHGILSQEDLSNYKVIMREPIEALYRGHKVVSMPPPSSGGIHIIEMLNILSYFDIKSMGQRSPQSLHILAETMKRAFADRALYLGDPDFIKVPLKKLSSQEHAAQWARNISLKHATPAKELVSIQEISHQESPSTTHISIVDSTGMAVSTTQTINYSFGSGVVAQGTGIVLNDEMDDFSIMPYKPNVYGLVGNKANAIAAHKTMLSSMSPTLVFDPAGELKLVVGSPGGPRIINATLQTIINLIDHGMSLSDAVHSYRIHHQWTPDIISYEPKAFNNKTAQQLKKLGHNLKELKSIGDVQAIQVNKKYGKLEFIGVSDTRSNGKPY
jgi:gamma-glutamyltranspeptidase/glutathione hydrolase